MKKNILIGILSMVFIGCAAAKVSNMNKSSQWKCEAAGMANYEFNGESTAYIHLMSYSSGNNYSVTFNANKTIAKGVTGDNTPFICKK